MSSAKKKSTTASAAVLPAVDRTAKPMRTGTLTQLYSISMPMPRSQITCVQLHNSTVFGGRAMSYTLEMPHAVAHTRVQLVHTNAVTVRRCDYIVVLNRSC
jgi:hypothetical protein